MKNITTSNFISIGLLKCPCPTSTHNGVVTIHEVAPKLNI